MKRILQLFLFFVLIFATINAKPVKRVLFEQHTGAWCGWCVDGTHKLQQILDAHPGEVIPVKLHNGDAMEIPEQNEVGKGLGLTGFPAGCIDRKSFNGTYFPNRYSGTYSNNAWLPLVESQLAQPPKVDVQMVYSINPETRLFQATVTATMLETVNQDLSFNVFIIEDSLSGTGRDWDQSNYLSNRVGWEFSPFYNLPNPIKGYIHEHVARKLLGGAWGDQASFVNPAEEGKVFKAYFETILDASWNLDQLHFVATIQGNSPNFREILNAVYGEKGTPETPKVQLTTKDKLYGVTELGESYRRVVTITNLIDEELTYVINVIKTPDTPADWIAEVNLQVEGGIIKSNPNSQSVELTIPAHGEASFELSLSPQTTIGYGGATAEIYPKNEESPIKGTVSIKVVSKEINNYYVVKSDNLQYSVKSYLPTEDNYFQIEPDVFKEFAEQIYSNIQYLVYDYSVTETISAEDLDIIQNVLAYGGNVFVVGDRVTSSLNSLNALPWFGLQYNYLSREGYGQAPYRVWLSGIEGDPISGTLGNNFEGNLKAYLLFMFKIQNKNNAHPIIRFSNNQTGYDNQNQTHSVPAEEAILGARINTDYNSKAVILSVHPSVIVNNNIRKTLVDNIFIWLKGVTDVENNTISVNPGVSISPNPVIENSSIKFVTNHSNIKVSVYNELGQEVKVLVNGNAKIGENTINLNAYDFTNGTYYVILKNGEKVLSTPFVIAK